MPRKNNRNGLQWILVLAVLGGGVAYWQWHKTPSASTAAAESMMMVSVVSPQQTSLSQKINVSGLVVPREDIVVTSAATGVRITELLVDEGKWVKKGQPLAQLDGSSAKNQLAQLEAQYKQAEQNFRRVDKIKKTGAVSLSDVEEKRTAYDAAKAQYNDAVFKVQLSTITAPASGLVYAREANVGALVGGNEPLFHIARDGAMELEAQASESDLAALKIGADVAVMLPGHTTSVAGKIRLVAPRIDNATRSAKLRISLPKNTPISIGSFAEAQVATHEAKGLVLPQTAINLVDGKTIVWVVGTDHKVSPLPVIVTLRDGNNVMVTGEGLAPDAQIVAKAGPFLHAGDSVTPATDAAETAK